MPNRKFSKEFMQSVLWEGEEGTEIIEDEIIDHTRWQVHHNLIFSFEGKFWSTFYSVGATEQQDECAWEYETEINCEEVEKVEVVKTEWQSVKGD